MWILHWLIKSSKANQMLWILWQRYEPLYSNNILRERRRTMSIPTFQTWGNPHKYESWWRVYHIKSWISYRNLVSDCQTKQRYTIVTGKEYMVEVTHPRPFYFDTTCVTPLNITVKDKWFRCRLSRSSRFLNSMKSNDWYGPDTETLDETWETTSP